MALVLNVAMLKATAATTQANALPFGAPAFGNVAGTGTDGASLSTGDDTMFAALLQQMSEPANSADTTAAMAVNASLAANSAVPGNPPTGFPAAAPAATAQNDISSGQMEALPAVLPATFFSFDAANADIANTTTAQGNAPLDIEPAAIQQTATQLPSDVSATEVAADAASPSETGVAQAAVSTDNAAPKAKTLLSSLFAALAMVQGSRKTASETAPAETASATSAQNSQDTQSTAQIDTAEPSVAEAASDGVSSDTAAPAATSQAAATKPSDTAQQQDLAKTTADDVAAITAQAATTPFVAKPAVTVSTTEVRDNSPPEKAVSSTSNDVRDDAAKPSDMPQPSDPALTTAAAAVQIAAQNVTSQPANEPAVTAPDNGVAEIVAAAPAADETFGIVTDAPRPSRTLPTPPDSTTRIATANDDLVPSPSKDEGKPALAAKDNTTEPSDTAPQQNTAQIAAAAPMAAPVMASATPVAAETVGQPAAAIEPAMTVAAMQESVTVNAKTSPSGTAQTLDSEASDDTDGADSTNDSAAIRQNGSSTLREFGASTAAVAQSDLRQILAATRSSAGTQNNAAATQASASVSSAAPASGTAAQTKTEDKSKKASADKVTAPSDHAPKDAGKTDAGTAQTLKSDTATASTVYDKFSSRTDSATLAATPVHNGVSRNDTASVATALHVSAKAEDSHTPAGLDSLGVRIAARAAEGHHQFDIRLDPAELGRVEVRLSMDPSGQTQAHVVADKPQTLDMLQRDAASLARSLSESGINLSNNGLNFSLREQNRQSQDGGVDKGRSRSLSVDAVVQTDTNQNRSAIASYVPGSTRLDIRV